MKDEHENKSAASFFVLSNRLSAGSGQALNNV